MGVCHIIGASELNDEKIIIGKDDLLIAADGGLRHCEMMGLEPDVIIGDFDSYGSIPQKDNVIRLNPIKDDTDTMICVRVGMERGYREFVLHACMGGRFAHVMGNLQTLAYIRKNNAHAFLIGEREIIAVIMDEIILFDEKCRGYISLFSMDESIIATEKNLKYSLDEDKVTNYTTIGVSNEFTGRPASITVKGLAAVVYDKKNGLDAVRFIEE